MVPCPRVEGAAPKYADRAGGLSPDARVPAVRADRGGRGVRVRVADPEEPEGVLGLLPVLLGRVLRDPVATRSGRVSLAAATTTGTAIDAGEERLLTT